MVYLINSTFLKFLNNFIFTQNESELLHDALPISTIIHLNMKGYLTAGKHGESVKRKEVIN
jgi:hypothetical protein